MKRCCSQWEMFSVVARLMFFDRMNFLGRAAKRLMASVTRRRPGKQTPPLTHTPRR